MPLQAITIDAPPAPFLLGIGLARGFVAHHLHRQDHAALANFSNMRMVASGAQARAMWSARARYIGFCWPVASITGV